MADKKNKLKITRGKYEGNQATFRESSDSVLTVLFNPTDYTISKSNAYTEAAIPGLESPIIQYNRGNTKTLSLELLLDTYSYEVEKYVGNQYKEDVGKYVEKLEKLVAIDGELHAPPPCRVAWGTLEFVGVLESLQKKYVMFLDDGTPVRARVTLSFKEYRPVDIQIRETRRGSPDRRKFHLVQQGDRITLIAFKAYGDPAYWKQLSAANNIDDPIDLEPGQGMIIPSLEDLEP